MILPITGIVHAFDAVVVAFCAWHIYSSYVKSGKKNLILKYFSLFFFFMAIFQLIMGIGHLPLVLGMPEIFPAFFSWSYIIGHIFLYVSMAYFIFVPSHIYFENSSFAKKFTKIYFYVIVLFGLVITAINIMNPLTTPYLDASTGLTVFNVPEIVGKIIPLIALISWAPAALLFIYKAIKLRGVTRSKSLLLGIGLIFVVIGGPLHDFARELTQYLIADVLTLTGFLLLFWGIFIGEKKVGESTETPQSEIV